MALQLVDIFGNLQPATGLISRSSMFSFIPLYKNVSIAGGRVYGPTNNSDDINFRPTPTTDYNWQFISSLYSKERMVSRGIYKSDIANNMWISTEWWSGPFDQMKKSVYSTDAWREVISINPNCIVVSFRSTDDRNSKLSYFNVYINLEETDIFKKTIGSKFGCMLDYDKFNGRGNIINGSLDFFSRVKYSAYFNIQTYSDSLIKSPEQWERKLLKQEASIKELLVEFNDAIKKNIDDGKLKKEDVPSCFLPDPDPALPGPPTQTISGVANKAPVVDNPNIKLPTQEVKQLDANAAQQVTSQAQGAIGGVGGVGGIASQAQGATGGVGGVGGIASQAQGATGGVGGVGGIASQAQGAMGGVGGIASQAQGAMGGIQKSAGNILGNLSSGVKGAIGGGLLGAGIGALSGGGKGAAIGALSSGLVGGITGKLIDKLNPKGIIPDGLGKNWSTDKFSPEAIAGNNKFVDPKTGIIGSTSELAKGAVGGIVSQAKGAVGGAVGGIASQAKGAVGGAVGGIASQAKGAVGGAVGGIASQAKGAVGGAVGGIAGGAVGAAAAKLSSVKKGLPKPNIPKPPNLPRIKTIKLTKPSNSSEKVAGLLNPPKSPLG